LPRLEVGGSFQHLLEQEGKHSFGFHLEWQPPPLPLDIRAEYARSHDGSGYWVESAYKLSQVPVWRNTIRHVQVVARMQQFFVNAAELETGGEGDDEDKGITLNTKMFEFGVNYYFRDDFRFVSSYGRQFEPEGGSANCGRCHQAPHKIHPRMMATIVRHMRVRATLTDEDMKAILAYMTQ
jgi:hypothetical protein